MQTSRPLSATKRADLDAALIDHTRITKGEAIAAVSRAPEGSGAAVYRGWMLEPEQYGQMHAALAARGVDLINTPEQ